MDFGGRRPQCSRDRQPATANGSNDMRTRASRTTSHGAAAGFLFLALAAPLPAQTVPVDLDTVHAGRFDLGKMWTFEYPPREYFTETYGFQADDAWFDRIRMSVLRIPGCSASFVSPDGLVVTNHHCVRGRIPSVAQPGERLLDDGFFATDLADERRIPGYYADQLLAVHDVSDRFFAELDRVTTDDERRRVRETVAEEVQRELSTRYEDRGNVWVQVIPLYNGGRYSAYVFRRFPDVRLVGAVELQAGFFGGDPDNFTYPRYALDFAFLRVYQDDEPYRTDDWLAWGVDGIEEGDPVFLVGNPGRTSRLTTMAQLHYDRDVRLPAIIGAFAERLDAMRHFHEAHPEEAEAFGIRNRAFGLSNTLKRVIGARAALEDPVIMAKRQDIEDQLIAAITADPDLQARYGDVIGALAAIQDLKRELGPQYGAFMLLGSTRAGSTTMARAAAAHRWLAARNAGLDRDSVESLARAVVGVPDQPRPYEQAMLAARFNSFLRHLGPDHPLTRQALDGMEPDRAAAALLDATPLSDSESTARAIEAGTLRSDDPAVRLATTIWPLFQDFSARSAEIGGREAELEAALGRARFAVYGTTVPPDGTSSPRIADGRVRSYEYNGTVAPPYTTLFGMYDHYYSYGPDSDWRLPDRFLPPPPELDLETPLNFVSTTDSYGGNSGSPAITPDHRIVGLNFDRNIEGLIRDYIYLPDRGRNVLVDVRAILEALDDLYDLDRIVEEILTGRAVATEAEADEDLRKE